MFSKPEILNEVAALEIFHNQMVYYKIRSASTPSKFPCLQSKIITSTVTHSNFEGKCEASIYKQGFRGTPPVVIAV